MALEPDLEQVMSRLADRTHELEERWRAAPVADRFLSVQRFLADGRMREEQRARVEELNQHVQKAWADLRANKQECKDAHDQIRLLALEAALAKAERMRDLYLDETGLVEELFCVSETYFMRQASMVGFVTFRDLVRRRDALQAELAPKTADSPESTQTMAVLYSLTGERIEGDDELELDINAVA